MSDIRSIFEPWDTIIITSTLLKIVAQGRKKDGYFDGVVVKLVPLQNPLPSPELRTVKSQPTPTVAYKSIFLQNKPGFREGSLKTGDRETHWTIGPVQYFSGRSSESL